MLTAAGVPHQQKPLDELGADLEAATLRALAAAYYDLNVTFFGGRLRRPTLELASTTNRLGRWLRFPRTLELSHVLLVEYGWGTVIEVLKHEMAHQYADEILGAADETAHGPAFRRVCERMGLRPEASGTPEPGSHGGPPRSRILKRVADLLALAASADLHEAKSAAAAAQRLMLKHNIELASRADRQEYGFRHLGRPSGRVPESEHILAGILAEHFFVEAIWVPAYRPEDGKRGSVLEIAGTPANLEMASYAHAFLRGTAQRLWTEHRKASGLRSNRDRRTFVAGVMEGFRERLVAEKREQGERGLVWAGDADLQSYHRKRHPHIRHVRLRGNSRNEARAQGRAAGRRIVLRRAMSDNAGRRTDGASHAPRRLPPGAPRRGR